jgi:hypothetical protein
VIAILLFPFALYFGSVALLSLFGLVTGWLEFIKPIRQLRYAIKKWLYPIIPTHLYTLYIGIDDNGIQHHERSWQCFEFKYNDAEIDEFQNYKRQSTRNRGE